MKRFDLIGCTGLSSLSPEPLSPEPEPSASVEHARGRGESDHMQGEYPISLFQITSDASFGKDGKGSGFRVYGSVIRVQGLGRGSNSHGARPVHLIIRTI